MINYGNFEIQMDEVVNDAFVSFSFDYDANISVEELFCMLIAYGLVERGYLKLCDLPFKPQGLTNSLNSGFAKSNRPI